MATTQKTASSATPRVTAESPSKLDADFPLHMPGYTLAAQEALAAAPELRIALEQCMGGRLSCYEKPDSPVASHFGTITRILEGGSMPGSKEQSIPLVLTESGLVLNPLKFERFKLESGTEAFPGQAHFLQREPNRPGHKALMETEDLHTALRQCKGGSLIVYSERFSKNAPTEIQIAKVNDDALSFVDKTGLTHELSNYSCFSLETRLERLEREKAPPRRRMGK